MNCWSKGKSIGKLEITKGWRITETPRKGGKINKIETRGKKKGLWKQGEERIWKTRGEEMKIINIKHEKWRNLQKQGENNWKNGKTKVKREKTRGKPKIKEENIKKKIEEKSRGKRWKTCTKAPIKSSKLSRIKNRITKGQKRTHLC